MLSMTRYARVGSSQKHKPIPNDPTPWQELSKKASKSVEPQKTDAGPSQEKEVKQHNLKVTVQEDNSSDLKSLKHVNTTNKFSDVEIKEEDCEGLEARIAKRDSKRKRKLHESKAIRTPSSIEHYTHENGNGGATGKYLAVSSEQSVKKINTILSVASQPLSKRQKKRLKSKMKKMIKLPEELENSSDKPFTKELEVTVEEPMSETKLIPNAEIKEEEDSDTSNQVKAENSDMQIGSDAPSSSVRKSLTKKEMVIRRIQKKRADQGILLLSPKTERKLYRMKKAFRKKGYAPEKIKEIIREERRKAENEARKTVTKTCFNCRKPGHVLANCPKPTNNCTEDSGFCFKCGSTDHTSFKCQQKVAGYPFATCFVCKLEGHISRDCPSNKNGIYPRGGQCNLCGSVNHLRAHCPKIKEEKEENSLALHTIGTGQSIDDEIFEGEEKTERKSFKKPKIVKF